MRMDVGQVIAPDRFGYFFNHKTGITSSYYDSNYKNGEERTGNGFVVYQNIDGKFANVIVMTGGSVIESKVSNGDAHGVSRW